VILAHISDPHVSTRDWAASDALTLAVRAVLGLRPVPDALLVGGDIADGADEREYARAAELFGRLPMPVHVIPGNHDDPERLASALGTAAAPFTADVGDVRLIGLDTRVAESDSGALGADAREWLAQTLAAAPDVPTVIAMHHPPLVIGVDSIDEARLDPDDARAFAALVADAPQVVRVVSGHVHRAVFATIGGRPFVSCPSVYLQARLALDGGPFELVPEPPMMALHVWRDGAMVTHLHPIRA
jgi:3',5'-cyclic AMP phosphodiesterase CpdA